jgi:hypothetical protein
MKISALGKHNKHQGSHSFNSKYPSNVIVLYGTLFLVPRAAKIVQPGIIMEMLHLPPIRDLVSKNTIPPLMPRRQWV